MDEHLDDLGIRCKTDKSSAKHGYLSSYEEFLPVARNEAFTFLEIGVFRGASALMWAEWFPQASVIGIDVKTPKRAIPKNLTLVVGDATSDAAVAKLKKRFVAPRVILDDGSHQWDQQRTSLRKLWSWLKPDGIYIIEDLHTSFAPGYSREDAFSFVDLMLKLAQSLQLRRSELARFEALGPPWFVEIAKDVRSVNFIAGAVLIRKK